jgi:hypothetical protein
LIVTVTALSVAGPLVVLRMLELNCSGLPPGVSVATEPTRLGGTTVQVIGTPDVATGAAPLAAIRRHEAATHPTA